MNLNLPKVFFRIKDNGANIFRVKTTGKTGRIELIRLGTAAIKSQKILAQDGVTITEDEYAQIREWLSQQTSSRLPEDLRRLSRDVNLAAQQISAKTELDPELESAINNLLLSLFDLQREVTEKILRRQLDQSTA